MTDNAAFVASDKQLLIRVVKDCQKQKLGGTQGKWEDYLKIAASGQSKTDPSAHNWEVSLIAAPG